MFGSKERKENKELKARVENLLSEVRRKNEQLAFKDYELNNKESEIEILKHNELVLLERNEEIRAKNKDLENNIEFLFSNLSPQKKKLIRPEG